MSTASLVYFTVDGFPTTLLPKNVGKTNYATIKMCHQLLTVNVVSVKSNLDGGQNGYLGILCPPKQYALIAGTPSILPLDLRRTATVQYWNPPWDEKYLLQEHKE